MRYILYVCACDMYYVPSSCKAVSGWLYCDPVLSSSTAFSNVTSRRVALPCALSLRWAVGLGHLHYSTTTTSSSPRRLVEWKSEKHKQKTKKWTATTRYRVRRWLAGLRTIIVGICDRCPLNRLHRRHQHQVHREICSNLLLLLLNELLLADQCSAA